ncbi:hypothetical protein ASPWEDRAFT_690763 [Aspergillus wentii DTO 134E9]|uniref:Uncharacterized protein n=1 Tax=Aspergillus wentii DTO 134E9 TaxID=1073089 RepID=A0A1L9R8X3_ASPWE|nr:uncharacterized protein ASPWEDRAFT_690763 [Aspergillus wentii DTO 134E9]OJJ31366.1 hypothetical protein ASPWEDRAFT_690763 [Aspergillus wentii DTO 134E9]
MHRFTIHSPSPISNTEGSRSFILPLSIDANCSPGRRCWPEVFDPAHFNSEGIEVPRDDMVFLACPGSEMCLHCGRHAAHIDCLVIAVDGACSSSGKDGARSAIGVLRGYGNALNTAL